MRELSEDTIWWTIKSATEFNAHRRTIVLFHNGTTPFTNLDNGNPLPNPLTWIDNTNSAWEPLISTLATLNPRTIAVNTHRDFAHAGGMHVGEMEVLRERLGSNWTERFIQTPEMMVIEFIGRRVDVGLRVEGGSVLDWYRKLEETTWAVVEEAFSDKVVAAGRTTTDVSTDSHRDDTYSNFFPVDSGYPMVDPGQDPSSEPHNLESSPCFCHHTRIVPQLVRLSLRCPGRRYSPR